MEATLLLFQNGSGDEYVVIAADPDVVDYNDHAKPGYKLVDTVPINYNSSLTLFPLDIPLEVGY